jgi:uncharacterized protein YdeI (YjbR/CyaY-like superfamily)
MRQPLPRVQPASRAAWRAWLEAHHASSTGIWLVYAKKHTGIPSLTYGDAVEEALCFGWIDSVLNPIDGDLYMQMFTPRKAKSVWSMLNRTRVEKLMAAGLMTPAGLALVEIAKKTGTWEALAHVEALTIPPELKKAFAANAVAKRNWTTYTASQRKTFLYSINNVKRAETRAARVAHIVDIVTRKVSFAQMRAEATGHDPRTGKPTKAASTKAAPAKATSAKATPTTPAPAKPGATRLPTSRSAKAVTKAKSARKRDAD